MTVDLKRMLQRRGLRADLPAPNATREGEIYITIDTGEMFFSNGVQYFNTITNGSIVDNVTTNDSTKPLSASMGLELDTRISNVNNYWQNYTNNMMNVINQKQDIMQHVGSSPPSDTTLFWKKV